MRRVLARTDHDAGRDGEAEEEHFMAGKITTVARDPCGGPSRAFDLRSLLPGPARHHQSKRNVVQMGRAIQRSRSLAEARRGHRQLESSAEMDFTSQKIPAIELQPWSLRGQLRCENWQFEALTGNLIET